MLKQQFHITPQKYLELERKAETRSEYFRGEIFALAGASRAHNLIATNTILSLGPQLKGRRCEIYSSDMRVKVNPTGLYTYPDVVVVCGQPKFDDAQKDTLLNPTLIVEVLSESTEAYDRTRKFEHYRTLESLTDYLLISQDAPWIEHRARHAANRWMVGFYMGLETVVPIPSLGCELPMTEVYDKIDWPDENSARGFLQAVKEPAMEYRVEPAAAH